MASKSKIVALVILVALLLFAISLMIGLSFSALNPTQVGLDFNWNTYNIDQDTLYDAGTHFLGLGHSFIAYPVETQVIRFDNQDSDYKPNVNDVDERVIQARTRDGIRIELSVSVQYRLIPTIEAIKTIYFRYEQAYEQFFEKMIRSAIRDVAATFTARDFRNRQAVTAALQTEVATVFDGQGALLVTIQLLNYALPAAFEEAIQETISAKQDQETAINEQSALNQTLIGNVRQAAVFKEQEITRLTAVGAAYLIEKQSEASIIETQLAELTEAIRLAKDKIFKNATENSALLSYLWIENLKTNKAAKVTVDIDTPAAVRLP